MYFEILDKCKDKLVPLREVAEIRRGYTTGINEFFYLTEAKIKHWGIEDEFLIPIIKSFKQFSTIRLDKSLKTNFYLFRCNKEKKKLKYTNALKYIEYGESQITKEGIPFPKVPSVKGRRLWYDISGREPLDIFVQEHWNTRFFIPVNEGGFLADKRLYEIKAKSEPQLLASLLNVTITFLFLEIAGRTSLGEGALDLTVYEFEELSVPQVTRAYSTKILKAFRSLLTRPIKPIFEEVKEKDRQRLDSLVLEAMGLDPKKYLKPIYDGLCELVRERIGLAGMRKRAKDNRTGRDVEKAKDELLRKILPEGPKKFPEEFLPSLKKEDFREISIPASPLKLGQYFLGRQEAVSEDGFSYKADSVEEAKFIIYAQRQDTFVVKVPKNDKATSKAVKAYEKYLRELKDEFFAAFFQRVHDHKQSDTLTHRVFQELGLPNL